MNIDTNTPVAALCDRLREISVGDCLLSDDKQFLAEAADRLELLAGENEDLRLQNHSTKIQAEVRWERIQRLRRAGDELAKWMDRNTPVTVRNDWTAAKEAKP